MKTNIVIFLFTLISANAAFALLDQNDIELSGSAAIDTQSGTTAAMFSSRLGFFPMGSNELELSITFLGAKPERQEAYLNILYEVNYTYNMVVRGSRTIPFVTLGVGSMAVWDSGLSSSDAILNAGAGLRILLGENVALRLEYRYRRIFADFNRENNNAVTLGLAFLSD